MLHRYSEEQEAVLRTVAYADVFHSPMTDDEIMRSLITRVPVRKHSVQQALRSLHVLQRHGKYWGLRGSLLEKYAERRERMEPIVREKVRKAAFAAEFLGRIPMILSVCITGGVSVGNVREDDDLDFMVIAQSGWMWTARFLAVILSMMRGTYRSRTADAGKERPLKDSWCLNLWLDEHQLGVPVEAQNMYTAHEVLQALPLFNKRQAYERFLSANAWIRAYFPHVRIPAITKKKLWYFPNPVEALSYVLQWWYMHPHRTTEHISRHSAFFHPRNTASIVKEAYARHLRELGVPPFPEFTREVQPSPVYQTIGMRRMLSRIRLARMRGKRIVLATGVFDLLHEEHVKFLEKAKAAGDILVVALESDKRTRALKGEGRPVQNQRIRLHVVKNLGIVDEAFILPDDFASNTRYEESLYHLRPDVYACSEHSPYQENKRRLIELYHGTLNVVHKHNKSVSTTKLLKS